MKIGELATRSGTTPRLLRYYEEQGLVFPQRSENGYREYDDRWIDRVIQIRGLLEAGLSTKIIKQLLPCLDKPRSIALPNPSAETVATLAEHRDRMTARIEALTTNRDAVDEYLTATRAQHEAVSRQ